MAHDPDTTTSDATTWAVTLATSFERRGAELRAQQVMPAPELADLLLDARLAADACGSLGSAALRSVDGALSSSLTGRRLVPAAEASELLLEVSAALRVAAVAAELDARSAASPG